MSQVFARRHLRGAHLFGLLLLLIVGASGQGALYWLEGIAADTQLLRQALQHQQQARQALDGLRTGIEQALQPQAQAEQEALTQDEASLFLDAHATEVGAALAALEALPLDEPSRSALQALRPTLKGRLADIQGVALIGLKTGSTNHLPAIRRALDRLTHELDQFQSLLLVELQASQQAAASARQQSQLALAALTGLALLTLLASGSWQDRKRQDQAQEEAAVLQPPAQAQDRPQTVAIERAEDPQQGETLAMLRQLSQSTDQLTRLVSQIKTPPVATASTPTPARPAAAQVSRPPSAEPARAAQAPHPMADLAGAIDDIAFQSSMLAMNAEAARSGAPGQDIAQLVDEVRLLASRSAQTAKAFKSRIQPQPAIEPVTDPAREPAKANLAEPRQSTTLEPDDDDAGGVVVQIRQTIELPPAPLAAAKKQQDKVVALEPHLAARQDDAEPQSAKAKPSSTVLRTGSLLRTRG